MTTAVAEVAPAKSRLAVYDRYLRAYPSRLQRTYYLSLTVLATVALYYQAYCAGTVAPQILNHYGITIKFYLIAAVIGLLFGAAATVLGGLADRIGRANLVAYGLLVVGVLEAFVHPHMPDKWTFVTIGSVIGFVEGIILVATPALMRDFSPRMGRATAMGFWAVGPVLGSLLATEVSSHTLDHLRAWQDQLIIAGLVGLGVGALVVYTLRELDPALRDQVMVSLQDRALIEARAKGIDVESALRNPWKQMVTPRIVTSAFAIGVFLMFYYVLVGALVIYLETTFLFSASKANSVANWGWMVHAISLVAFGYLSDRFRVRKPFMVVGGIGSLVTVLVFASYAVHPGTTATKLAVTLGIQAVFGAMVFAPWMAGFTETVEDRNPALVATGLAVSGGVLRIVVGITIFMFPFVVPAVTPLVDYGPQVAQYSARYASELQTAQAITPSTLTALKRNPRDGAAIAAALREIESDLHVTPGQAISRLEAVGAAVPELTYLQRHGPAVLKALKQDPPQWRRWWLVTAVGQVLFLPLILAMVGPWTPAAGRRRDEEQEAVIRESLREAAPAAV